MKTTIIILSFFCAMYFTRSGWAITCNALNHEANEYRITIEAFAVILCLTNGLYHYVREVINFVQCSMSRVMIILGVCVVLWLLSGEFPQIKDAFYYFLGFFK